MPFLGLVIYKLDFDERLSTYHTRLTASRDECLEDLWRLFWDEIFGWDAMDDIDRALRTLAEIDPYSLFIDSILYDKDDNEIEYQTVGEIKEKLIGMRGKEIVINVINAFFHNDLDNHINEIKILEL
jgi:hypothetical protein